MSNINGQGSADRIVKFNLFLISVSLVLFSYSTWEIKWNLVENTNFLGLTSSLTFSYWLGLLILLFVSIYIYNNKNLKSSYIFLLTLFLLGTYIFGIGVFPEENTRMPWSYYPAGEAKILMEQHHFDPNEIYPLISYHSWPGFHFLSAILLYILNIDINLLLKYMPLFWVFIYILVTFTIGKKINFSLNQSFLLSYLSLSCFILSQYYYCPQSIAILYFLILFLLYMSHKDTPAKKIFEIIIFVAMIITHVLTPIVSMSAILALSIKRRKSELISFVFIFFWIWYIYVLQHVFEVGIMKVSQQIVNMDAFTLFGTIKYQPITETKWLSNIIRFSFLAIVASLASISILLFKLEDKSTRSIFFNEILFWLIGTAAVSFLKYGTEAFERLYIFCLIPAICLIITKIKTSYIIIPLMILLLGLHIPAHYADESYLMTHTTDLKGSEFIGSNFMLNETLFYQLHPYVHFFDPRSINQPYYYFQVDQIPDTSILQNMSLIINSRQSYNFFTYMYGTDFLQNWVLLNNKSINLLYNNGYYKIYKKIYYFN